MEKQFVKDSRVPFAIFLENKSFHNHFHYEFEILYLISGKFTVKIGEKEYKMTPGDMYFAMPFEEHEYISDERNYMLMMIVPPSSVPEYSNIMLYNRIKDPVISTSKLFKGYADMIMCCGHYFNRGTRNENVLKGMLLSLLSEFFDNVELKPWNQSKCSTIELILTACMKNYTNQEFNLEYASKIIGYNSTYISHIMSECLGIGFSDFVNSLRVERAYYLLCETDQSITQIAYDCGFGSQRNFNRVFMKFSGRTPRDYRGK